MIREYRCLNGVFCKTELVYLLTKFSAKTLGQTCFVWKMIKKNFSVSSTPLLGDL